MGPYFEVRGKGYGLIIPYASLYTKTESSVNLL